MKISAIFIAAVVACASGSRLVRTFDPDSYRDSPFYFDSPPPPLSPPRLRPPSFLSSYSSSRPETYLRDSASFGEDASIFSDGPPTPSEGKVYYDSYFPSPRRPHQQSFYSSSSFKEDGLVTHDYRGPPPPMPGLSEDLPRKQHHHQPLLSHEHYKHQEHHRLPSLEQQLQEQLQHQMTRIPEELKTQQETTATTSAVTSTTMHHHDDHRQQQQHRQPLSFGGHSSHFSYGNHGLGFASVSSGSPDLSSNHVSSGNHHGLGFASIANSPELNPLVLAEMMSSAKMNSQSTISMQKQQSSASGIEVSQSQPVTSSPPPEASTPSPSTAPPKMTATSPAATSTMRDSGSTTPMVTPRSNLDSIQGNQNQRPGASTMFQEQPRTSYNFGTITQEYPPIAHGQLPIEPSRQQVPDYKQNFLVYEAKSNYPFIQQPIQQIQQISNDNINAAPVRFSIPTVPIATASQAAQVAGPTKFVIQGALDLSRMPLALAAVPSQNSYIPGQNHIEITQSDRSNGAANTIPNAPSFYFVQSNDQTNAVTKQTQGIPLGSFFLMPNNEQSKQTVQALSGAPQGLQLQLGGYGGVEYISSSPGNAESTRAEIGRVGGGGANLQEHLRSLEPTYAKIQNGHNFW